MAKKRTIDIEIDKLTNSIELIATGEVFDTQVVQLSMLDRGAVPKRSWRFDWREELMVKDRRVFALVTVADPRVLQGLISMEERNDHVFVHLVESARFNQGKGKVYSGVPANLFAYACRESIRLGHSGVISFIAKTKLVEHYRKMLKAEILWGTHMSIDTDKAIELVARYFPMP